MTSRYSSFWTPKFTARIQEMFDLGLTRMEMSKEFGRPIGSITQKLFKMGITGVPLGAAPVFHKWIIDNPNNPLPRFEDITPAEARSIVADAPRSARIPKPWFGQQYSLMGSAANMCAGGA